MQEVHRKYLPLHLQNTCLFRMVSCHYCSIIDTAMKISDHECVCECFRWIVQTCGKGKKFHQHINGHRSECSQKIVDCRYSDVGCSTKVTRLHVEKHDFKEQNLHLDLMTAVFQQAAENNLRLQQMVYQGKSKVYDYHQKLVEKDLQLQKTQAKLEQVTAEFKIAAKACDSSHK